MPEPHPLTIGAFAVDSGVAVVADEDVPVAAEIDVVSGEVRRVYTWPASTAHGGECGAVGIALRGDEIIVSSPVAGGLVRIDRRSGASQVVALDARPGRLIASDRAVWLTASAPSDLEHTQRALRDVVWEDPTDDERAAWARADAGHGWFTLDVAESDEPTTVAEWQHLIDHQDDVDERRIQPPTLLWRVTHDALQPLAVDGVILNATAAGTTLVLVVQRPSHPVVRYAHPSGSLSELHPGVVVAGDDGRPWQVVGEVPDSEGCFLTQGDQVFLAGSFGDRLFESARLCPLDLAGARIGDPVPWPLVDPVGMLDGWIVDRTTFGPRPGTFGPWPGGIAVEGFPGSEGFQVFEMAVPRVVNLEDGTMHGLAAPPIDQVGVSSGADLWFAALDRTALVAITAREHSVRVLEVALDCGPCLPAPQAPEGLDFDDYERSELEGLRRALMEGWTDDAGVVEPFIGGVTFESIEKVNAFPDAAVVARFRSDDHPGITFGRRWPLYDALGAPCGLDLAEIELMEDIEAEGYGLPPLSECHPDADGIVWF